MISPPVALPVAPLECTVLLFRVLAALLGEKPPDSAIIMIKMTIGMERNKQMKKHLKATRYDEGLRRWALLLFTWREDDAKIDERVKNMTNRMD